MDPLPPASLSEHGENDFQKWGRKTAEIRHLPSRLTSEKRGNSFFRKMGKYYLLFTSVTYSGSLSVTVNDINIQHNQNYYDPTPTIILKSVTVKGTQDISYKSTVANITKTSTSSNKGKYTLNSAKFDIKDLKVSGIGLNDETKITVVVNIQYGNTSKDFTVEYNLSNIQ